MNIDAIYTGDRVAVSFELFPPKTEPGMNALAEHVREMVTCEPAFITCTYGAGGSTRDSTLKVLARVHQEHPQVPVVSHLTCVGSSVDELHAYLLRAVEEGISAIVALRGDPPRGESSFRAAANGLNHANELVALIREAQPDLGILVAGYPEKHIEASSFEVDLQHLKQKVEAGANAVVSQLFYNNDDFLRFRDRCDQVGIAVPIVPGILPVISLSQIKTISTLCGATLPEKIVRRLEHFEKDEEGQFSVGAYYAARQVEELVEAGVPGVHFYVLNRSRAAALICRALTLSHLRH